MQATRLQLLESLLEILQTEDIQDARRLRALLDSKYGLIDAKQRPFYSFWAHMNLQEPDIALRHYLQLSVEVQREYWQIFMQKVVETGDWATGVKLWFSGRHRAQWRGNPTTRRLLDLIPNLHTFQFLTVLPVEDAEELKSKISSAIIIHLAACGSHGHAVELIEQAILASKVIGDATLAAVIRALGLADLNREALALYSKVRQTSSYPSVDYRSNVAVLNASAALPTPSHMRDLLADGILQRLKAFRGNVRIIEPYTTAMAVFARYGLVKDVDELFADFTSDGSVPDVIMFSTLVHARTMTLEVSEAVALFHSCEEKYGIKPDQVLHNILLHAFADTGNVYAATELLLAMFEAGHAADPITASTLIDLFARTKDADGAETAFKRMLEFGVKPNVRVYGSLIHAYVEAGDVERFDAAFQDFQAAELRPNSQIMNILLKQLRKEGRSYEEMRRLVDDMGAMSVIPTSATYTQLMRALLSENKLKMALDIFQSLKEPNEYHYTIIMVGFIREGTPQSMNALMYYYNEMIERKLQPSYITLAVLMNAFVLRRSRTFAKRANELLDTLADWGKVDISSKFAPRTVPSPDVYAPLLRREKSGHIRFADPERVFKQFLTSLKGTDGRPDIRTLTSLMSIYAVADRVNDVQSLFVAIKKESDRLYRYSLNPPLVYPKDKDKADSGAVVENGQKRPGATPGVITQVAHGARFVLAASLKIFTGSMVRAGRISQVERVWAALPKQGYAFDVQNWNQYIQLQIGLGNIERACNLVTNNLLEDGGRIYKRTKYQLLAAFETLRAESTDGQGDQGDMNKAEERQSKKETWERIQKGHKRLLEIVEEA
ncbi:protein of unknown function [Taphrina deformans PYCC 5710]|uniref:PROP1-like PPR domain-containing protein n=1 Tax=Taphrina deformans (strain PYCC 5710 / ATCC 11124 / CBS 356.35 / IMI 108563 / JCM 9778 / NBRC 8474) TaxID=1097556 RepID=R4XJR0_TAPDE|nr:protein of unknown function [Taphrina deformans PYCC 5710]|eukprot:CCG84668.1 protein of unknown function [Taphrina deformans PYCC 5710]